jgi:hypothetical protein
MSLRRFLPRRFVRRPRGQAMTEVALLTTAIIGAGAGFVYFFPDSLNATQIYMDSFYFVLSMPVP